jgi:hypothetical protein
MTFRLARRLAAVACAVSVLLAALVFATAAPASAVTCNTIPSVKNSAVLSANTAAGGHVTSHVLGQTPGGGAATTQAGRTLFADGAKYAAAWRQYTYYGTVNCGGGGQAQQQLTLAQLHMTNLDAYSCTAANAQGACTAKTLYVAQAVFYGFILNGQNWILNTAFPVPLTTMVKKKAHTANLRR